MDVFWNSSEYINLLQPFISNFETALNLSSVNKQAQYSYVNTYDYCKRQPLINSNINFKNHCIIKDTRNGKEVAICRSGDGQTKW